MTIPGPTLIDDIRAASRQMVRELGFMEATLAATDYPPSAVHTLLEIGARGPMTSGQLAEFLGLEKSSISRMVRKLVACGELKETSDADDARIKPLSLTPKGRRTLTAIHDFARRQVSSALRHLSDAERRTVCEGLMLYARALKADRLEQDSELSLASG
ncbi:MAG TPA: MarR family winged helix-turn-helix transcriptional regulator [Bradyrhizobium sp.]